MPATKPLTFDEALGLFRERLAQPQLGKQGKLPRTIENYSQIVRWFQTNVCDLLGPSDAVQTALAQWVKQQDALYLKKKTSASKLRVYLSALRAFFGTLADRLPTNPAATLTTCARRTDTVPRPVAREYLDALMGALDQASPVGVRDAAMIWLYYNGLRNTEVGTLTTDRISFSSESQTLVLSIRGKGDKYRKVVQHSTGATFLAAHLLSSFVPTEYQEWVREYVAELEAEVGEADYGRALLLAADRLLTRKLPPVAIPVFVTERSSDPARWPLDKPVGRRWSNKMFRRYAERAALPASVGPHALRHTFATDLLNRDVDLKTLAELLGHSSIRQTAGYAAVLEGKKARAVKDLYTPASVRRPLEAAWSS